MVTDEEVMNTFAFAHLPDYLQKISEPFYDTAVLTLMGHVPEGEMRTKALWRLWEAKNLAVAAAVQANKDG